jgi:hypothetical protein
LIPEMASMTDDFPVDCSPVTLVSGKIIAYQAMRLTQDDAFRQRNFHPLETKTLQAVDGRYRILDVESQRVDLACHRSCVLLKRG